MFFQQGQAVQVAAQPVRCWFRAKKVFSRFDQLAQNYLALVQFALVMIWLRQMSTLPRNVAAQFPNKGVKTRWVISNVLSPEKTL
jgi:hypothetical protein